MVFILRLGSIPACSDPPPSSDPCLSIATRTQIPIARPPRLNSYITPPLVHCNIILQCTNTLLAFGLGRRLGRGLGRSGSVLAEFLGLFGERFKLASNILSLKLEHILDVLGADDVLRKLEGTRYVAFGEGYRLFTQFFGVLLGAGRLPLECAHGAVGGGNEAIKGLLGLFDAFFGERPQFRRNLKLFVCIPIWVPGHSDLLSQFRSGSYAILILLAVLHRPHRHLGQAGSTKNC